MNEPIFDFSFEDVLAFIENLFRKLKEFFAKEWTVSEVPNLLGTRDCFHGRQFFPGHGLAGLGAADGLGMIQVITFIGHFISDLMLPLI